MPIHYALFENNVTTDPDDFAAQVQITASHDLDSLINRMVAQGSTSTRADILAVLEDAITACEGILLDGGRVNFGGLVELFPRVSGVFHGATDAFDPARHRVDVAANAGVRVRDTVRDNAQLVKQDAVKPTPTPLEYLDLGSAQTNAKITPGNIGTVNGHRLKFNPAHADEGVFFLKVGGATTKVTAMQRNKPGQLVFLIPAGLTAGNYTLEVRARVAGGLDLRTGHLDATLNV